MKKATVGFAFCGSYCTFSKVLKQFELLSELGYDLIPIMSENAYSTDTRFGKAKDFADKIEGISGKKIISTISGAEPIGPKKMCDILVVAPCTGNTLAKLSNGITDTSVTMAVKSHLRIQRPVLLAPATNDALGSSAQNIGRLFNVKNIYFVPMAQDDCVNKPNSLVADFNLLTEALEEALNRRQIQPLFKVC
ncbi:dipicolinate synthase subunit B [Anaeromassilibacillus sp. An172]|uniref:dipicolinate synthase subunit B n=1 Tax=Anaeromassilibacillus sp. An172 TaxID=1965570 RepID=UPI000B3737BA|nr:dipicolinate synthase subunit B [Anaeromassilibacillus sp. An172]OUP78949.1 dipicolinate synthase subunit B [Anaeromassilibacillus sp. An172]